MAEKLVVYKGRRNVIDVYLNFDIVGDTITSQIKTEDGTLIATWTVVVVLAVEGRIQLVLDDSVTSSITYKTGFMDLKRVSFGEPYAVFDHPIEVEFRSTVTS